MVVHGSDCAAEAQREIELWFGEGRGVVVDHVDKQRLAMVFTRREVQKIYHN
jgi:hypothetical protein